LRRLSSRTTASVTLGDRLHTAVFMLANDLADRLGAEAKRCGDLPALHTWLSADHHDEQVALDRLLIGELANQVAAHVDRHLVTTVVNAPVGGEVAQLRPGIDAHPR